MGKIGRIMMVVGIILALYAALKVVGLVASMVGMMTSMMFRMFFPAVILILALVVFYAGYRRMKRGG